MQKNSPRFSRRSILSHAAIGLPAAGVLGVMAWAHPAATPEASALEVDGWWGSATTLRLQQVLGTYADGIVSGQASRWRHHYPRLGSGWEWNDGDGSSVIAAMQRRIRVSADGYFGPETAKALKRYLFIFSYGPATPTFDEAAVKVLQRRLARWRF